MQAATDQSEIELYQRKGFGNKLGFGSHPALIVIDIMKGFTDPTTLLGSDLESQVAAIHPLLAAAHDAGVPVIFTTVIYDDPNLRDAGIRGLKSKGNDALRPGRPEVEIDPRLDMRPTDKLMVKKHSSAFFGTDLFSRLTFERVDTLIITGCSTSGCVRSTVVDACQYGFRPIVVEEAVGDRSAVAHRQSLFDMNAKWADVVSLDETLAYLKAL